MPDAPILHRVPRSQASAIELGPQSPVPSARGFCPFGCDVIKVEQAEGDAVRSLGHRHKGRSLYTSTSVESATSQSICEPTPVGSLRVAFVEAISWSKTFARTLDELGYETLSNANPGLIMVQISGYGQNGQRSRRLRRRLRL